MAEKTALEHLASIDAGIQRLILVLSPQKPVHVNLDDQWGDPVIKAKDPRDWAGDTMQGKKFSECPAEYLDLLADRYDYFSERETDPKKAGYNRMDAARARGWAARIRDGYKPETVVDEDPQFDGRW